MVAGLPTLRAYGAADAQVAILRRITDGYRTTTMSTLRIAFLSALALEDREPLFAAYAPVPRMRLNNGIRRRLAPLLGNDLARIELATALTLSLPGAPIVYYGDEIGLGDNIALADRDGVRTPMQWDGRPHGGFSAAPDDHRLVLPVLDDSVYGYRRVSVAAQQDDPGSLLNRIRHWIRVRQQLGVFGAGTIRFLASDDPRVLAFVRGDGAQAVLVLANLSRKVETVRLRGLQVAGDELARGQVAGEQMPGEQLPGKWMSVGSETGASIDILDEDSLRAELPASAIGWWTRVGQQNG